jgi:hypothetical protein
VSDLMFKSLKLCEGLQFPDENLNVDVKHRIGTVHYRLASLYHNSWRMLVSWRNNFMITGCHMTHIYCCL